MSDEFILFNTIKNNQPQFEKTRVFDGVAQGLEVRYHLDNNPVASEVTVNLFHPSAASNYIDIDGPQRMANIRFFHHLDTDAWTYSIHKLDGRDTFDPAVAQQEIQLLTENLPTIPEIEAIEQHAFTQAQQNARTLGINWLTAGGLIQGLFDRFFRGFDR